MSLCFSINSSIYLENSDISVTYLETWAVHLKPFTETYNWIELKELPVWSTGESPVKATVKMLLDKKIIAEEENQAVFDELVNIKMHLKSVPLVNGKSIFDIWNEKHAPLEHRWLEVFTQLRKKSVSYERFAKIVEYALMIPGIQIDKVFEKLSFALNIIDIMFTIIQQAQIVTAKEFFRL